MRRLLAGLVLAGAVLAAGCSNPFGPDVRWQEVEVVRYLWLPGQVAGTDTVRDFLARYADYDAQCTLRSSESYIIYGVFLIRETWLCRYRIG